MVSIVAISPFIFEENSFKNNMTHIIKLNELLNDIRKYGLWIQISQRSLNIINALIANYEESGIKKDIEEKLKIIHGRNRLKIFHNLDQIDIEKWQEQIIKDKDNYDIELAFCKEHKDFIRCITTYQSEIDIQSLTIRQNSENLKTLMQPILSYSKELKVYDPYFNFTQNRTFQSLELIAQLLGSKLSHGSGKGKIDIYFDYTKTNNPNFNIIKQKIEEIQNQSQHNITAYLMENFHPRFIVADQIAITSDRGFSIYDHDIIWSFLNDKTVQEYMNKFEQNSQHSIKLKAIITSDEIKEVLTEEVQNRKTYTIEEIANELQISIDDLINKANDKRLPAMPRFSKEMRPLGEKQKDRLIKALRKEK